MGLLKRPLIPSGSTPLDDLLALEKTLINKCLKIGFRALTCFPHVFGGGGGGGLSLFPLSLGGISLAAGHPCGHETIHSHALGGYA
jgi:hypothetical protein